MAPRSTIILLIAVCLLTATGAGAKSHDVISGMSIENALLVVKKCIIEASAFKDPRTLNRLELRAQDSLEFAGITDAARLSALRRYIIRNNFIGVQSIWGVRAGDNFAQPYLIRGSTLDKIDKTWTIEKLAREIAANAGLPFLGYSKVSKILANCRYDAQHPPTRTIRAETPVSCPAPTPTPNPDPTPSPAPGATPSPTPLTTLIRDDLEGSICTDPFNITGQKELFGQCILTNEKRGIRSAGIVDGEGDYYRYEIKDFEFYLWRTAIPTTTYGELLDYIYKNARVPVSPDITARIVVMNFAISLANPNCSSISFPISRLCQFPSELSDTEVDCLNWRNKKHKVCEPADKPCREKEILLGKENFLLDKNTTLGDVRKLSTVQTEELKLFQSVSTYKGFSDFKLKQNSVSERIPPELDKVELSDSKKLLDVINEVTNKLDKERN